MMMFAGVLTVGASAAVASSGSLNEFRPGVMPVLVHVDAKGKVTEVSPSAELSPKVNRLLRQSLDEMISKPATEHGRPVSSQFVINLAVQASPRPEGDYLARFVYVSSSPVPNGSWFWVHVDGYRLALANRDDLNNRQPHPHFDTQREYPTWNNPNYPRTPPPPIQNTASSAPSPAPKPGH
ncbi:PAS domain-containing protein [Rhodanobacter panaciterrae]|nr:PAS domain-containing protein [Rhodanobacter panaciterrae]